MNANEEKSIVARPNHIKLEDRSVLQVSGVKDVDSFDEQTVVAYTDLGELTIKGTSLHIEKLNVQTGDLALSGNIFGLVYSDDGGKKNGFFSRLFK